MSLGRIHKASNPIDLLSQTTEKEEGRNTETHFLWTLVTEIQPLQSQSTGML